VRETPHLASVAYFHVQVEPAFLRRRMQLASAVEKAVVDRARVHRHPIPRPPSVRSLARPPAALPLEAIVEGVKMQRGSMNPRVCVLTAEGNERARLPSPPLAVVTPFSRRPRGRRALAPSQASLAHTFLVAVVLERREEEGNERMTAATLPPSAKGRHYTLPIGLHFLHQRVLSLPFELILGKAVGGKG